MLLHATLKDSWKYAKNGLNAVQCVLSISDGMFRYNSTKIPLYMFFPFQDKIRVKCNFTKEEHFFVIRALYI